MSARASWFDTTKERKNAAREHPVSADASGVFTGKVGVLKFKAASGSITLEGVRGVCACMVALESFTEYM